MGISHLSSMLMPQDWQQGAGSRLRLHHHSILDPVPSTWTCRVEDPSVRRCGSHFAESCLDRRIHLPGNTVATEVNRPADDHVSSPTQQRLHLSSYSQRSLRHQLPCQIRQAAVHRDWAQESCPCLCESQCALDRQDRTCGRRSHR